MRIEHILPNDLIRNRPVRVLVIGAGGTGSAIVLGLPYLDQAMRAWGHRYGLEVTLMDGDLVSETNCVRQPFSFSDIGQNKAIVLINRINLFWGMRWTAIPYQFHARSFDRRQDQCPDLVLGCVDTRAGRRAIAESLSGALNHVSYWLDLGNNAASGQYVLGQPLNARNRRKAERLRTVSELYPEVIDIEAGEDPLPSCSAVEALDRQEPFINQTLAASALAMLARLFRYGRLSHHGAFFNAKTGQMSAIPVDPVLWSKTRRRSRNSAVQSSAGRTVVNDQALCWEAQEIARMNMTLVPEIAAEAKALVALAFRNGPIEDLHAGKLCPTCCDRPEFSHISDDEIKTVMKAAVDALYRLLWQREYDPEKYQRNVAFGLRYTKNWDDPELRSRLPEEFIPK